MTPSKTTEKQDVSKLETVLANVTGGFRFLCDDYGFVLLERQLSAYGVRVDYIKGNVAVRISHDVGEEGVRVQLVLAESGNMPAHSIFVHKLEDVKYVDILDYIDTNATGRDERVRKSINGEVPLTIPPGSE